jgi:hypothetical protein
VSETVAIRGRRRAFELADERRKPGGQSKVLVGGIHGRSAPQAIKPVAGPAASKEARGLVRLDYFRIADREWTAME